jgi:hypothetical protein
MPPPRRFRHSELCKKRAATGDGFPRGMIEALKLATLCAEPGELYASPGSGRKPPFCSQNVHENDQKRL